MLQSIAEIETPSLLLASFLYFLLLLRATYITVTVDDNYCLFSTWIAKCSYTSVIKALYSALFGVDFLERWFGIVSFRVPVPGVQDTITANRIRY